MEAIEETLTDTISWLVENSYLEPEWAPNCS